MNTKALIFNFILCSFCNIGYIFAQDYKTEIGFSVENDFYIAFKQDRYYTNGFFVHVKRALNQQNLSPDVNKTTLELELGQKIYTPYFGKAPDPSLHDRPFSAYLYGGITYNRFMQNEQLFKYTLQGGATGKTALGKEVQTEFHKLVGIYKIAGWDYQLKGEYALNANFEYDKLLWRTGSRNFDVTGTAIATLGNAFTGLSGGGMLRFGKLNPIYSSASYNSRISNHPDEVDKNIKGEFFLYFKPLVNYVAYDSSIQGGLFLEDKGPISFDPKRIVFSEQLGLTFSSQRWTATYAVTFKSREVESRAKSYYYAGLNFRYRLHKN
ncbi:MAG: lipid A deacylase LpxR family protein [Bacteroidota bacterium]